MVPTAISGVVEVTSGVVHELVDRLSQMGPSAGYARYLLPKETVRLVVSS